MKLLEIHKKIVQHQPFPEGNYRLFGILIPLIKVDDELHILFEVRAHTLRSQPGEICLPGGAIEVGETPCEAAVRETCEELLIKKENIEVIGSIDYVITPFNYALYPCLGILNDYDPLNQNFNREEVEEVFSVPLNYFLTTMPETYFVSSSFEFSADFPFDKIQNGKEYNWKVGQYPVLFYEYNNYVIWGMTARILQNLVNILKTE